MPERPKYQPSQDSKEIPNNDAQEEQTFDKLIKRPQSERPLPFESVDEMPGLSKKLFFAKEFSVFEDMIDAENNENGKVIANVPAVYTVILIAFKDKLAKIGDEEGNAIGWVNVKESSANAWDIPEVFLPNGFAGSSSYAEIYDHPTAKSPPQIERLKDTSIFPIQGYSNREGKGLLKISSDISTRNRSNQITKPSWISTYNSKDYRIASKGLVIEKQKLQRYKIGLSFIARELSALTPAERRGEKCEALIKALRINYLQLLGIDHSRADEEKSKHFFQGNNNSNFHFTSMNIDDIRQMDNRSFQDFILMIQAVTMIVEEKLESEPGSTLNINGKDKSVYSIECEYLY